MDGNLDVRAGHEPDKYIDDHDVIKVGDRELEVIWTPGHSPGHNVIYLRKEKVMIVGDHLLPKITPHVGIYPDAAGTTRSAISSIRNSKFRSSTSSWCCPRTAASITTIVIARIS